MDAGPFRSVIDGYRADITRRAALIAGHHAAVAALEQANAADAGRIAAAEDLIADLAAAGAPMPAEDIHAAALIGDRIHRAGIPNRGKHLAGRLAPSAPFPAR
jgi:hypothetical protein